MSECVHACMCVCGVEWNECSRVLYLQNTTGFASVPKSAVSKIQVKLALLAIPFTFLHIPDTGFLFGAGNAHSKFKSSQHLYSKYMI